MKKEHLVRTARRRREFLRTGTLDGCGLSTCAAKYQRLRMQNAAVSPGYLFENCDETLLDGFSLRGWINILASAVCFRITTKETFSGLRISNVSARGLTDAGIVLETSSKQRGTLTDYLVTGNLATVDDRI